MYQLALPEFEGPLELLLRLVERNDLDVTAVALVEVADQYLAIVHGTPAGDPVALAEFVRIGARLMYIKSRALLPPSEEEEEPFDDDPITNELVEQLAEFRLYRAAVEDLSTRLDSGLRAFPRLAPIPPVETGPGLRDVSLDALRELMQDVLSRIEEKRPPASFVARPRISLSDRIDHLRDQLRLRGRLPFRRLLMAARTREDVVLAFLAVLELIKQGQCEAVQDANWGEIELIATAAPTVREASGL